MKRLICYASSLFLLSPAVAQTYLSPSDSTRSTDKKTIFIAALNQIRQQNNAGQSFEQQHALFLEVGADKETIRHLLNTRHPCIESTGTIH